jgi:hypothetical protein
MKSDDINWDAPCCLLAGTSAECCKGLGCCEAVAAGQGYPSGDNHDELTGIRRQASDLSPVK